MFHFSLDRPALIYTSMLDLSPYFNFMLFIGPTACHFNFKTSKAPKKANNCLTDIINKLE